MLKSAIAPLRPLLAAFGLSLLVAAGPLSAATAFAVDASHLRIGANSVGRTQMVTVGLNKSLIVDLPANVTEVIVSQPSVAGAIMRTRNRAIIQGVSPGSTNILFLDARGQSISVLDVSVGGESTTLAATLRRLLPYSNISVESFGDRVILSGSAQSQDDAARAMTIAAQFAGSADNVANLITVDGAQQVMLKVVIAEVQRSVVKELGLNLSGSLTVGNVNLGFNTSQPNTFTALPQANGVNAGLNMPNLSINAAISALNDRNALRLLAEPTLTAMSGQSANFLAGGELPFPVSRDANGNTVIEWKPFGVELDFTPTVKSNGVVGMKIRTSVSEIRSDGALNKREVNTSVELGIGQTLSLGGILQDTSRQQIAGLPGLGDIPILGALFRSRQYQRNQTELVVLVTPYLARPNSVQDLPTDNMLMAGDAEAVFLGHLEKMYGVGPAGMRGGYKGSIGFVLD